MHTSKAGKTIAKWQCQQEWKADAATATTIAPLEEGPSRLYGVLAV